MPSDVTIGNQHVAKSPIIFVKSISSDDNMIFKKENSNFSSF